VRSDSDLYTFGYRFKPWVGPPIASGRQILDYLGEVIEENGLAEHVRYGRRVTKARWSSAEAQWALDVVDANTGETTNLTAGFLWMCQGYYRQSEGHTPTWPGMEDFAGRIVHPQAWPEDLDYKAKTVVIIGSGATAATLAPAIAQDCAHVTILQRSPTYFIAQRNANDLADTLRELEVDEHWVHEIVRRKILKDQALFMRLSKEQPEVVKTQLLAAVAGFVGEEETARNFTPSYRPWRQRVAFVPGGDLFESMKSGKLSVVTGEIERFTSDGIALTSGETLQADIVISATGFNVNVLGDIAFEVDGEPLDLAASVTWRGMMFTGLPNLAWIFGYFRASWTLRVDLICDFVCRLINHMSEIGAKKAEVALRPEDQDMPLFPWVDPEDFNPGYLMRGVHLLPKRGDKPEWRHTQDYWTERKELPAVDLDGAAFVYDDASKRTAPRRAG
jgi:cation diffusion facilitator CzcD-associated flavoprotein CzcO